MSEIRTEHPYIIRMPGVCGGRPIVRGSRIPVWLIAAMYKAGDTAGEILQGHPDLSLAQIYDALSYYYDHLAEIEREISENTLQHIIDKHGYSLAPGGLLKPHDLHDR